MKPSTEPVTCARSTALSLFLKQPTHATGSTASRRGAQRRPPTRNWPSGEKAQHSGWLFLPNLIVCSSCVGNCSSSSRLTGAVPRNKSNLVPGGRSP
eukprot:scaffold323_cov414-Prasinococcus_capsulatus_cf.AAC.12